MANDPAAPSVFLLRQLPADDSLPALTQDPPIPKASAPSAYGTGSCSAKLWC